MPGKISRSDYADMFDPTVGDKLRLADTDLIVEVEIDLIVERATKTRFRETGHRQEVYGEEVKFGGGKVIRDGMGQSQVRRAAGAVDTVITNSLIVDHSGTYKADVGIKGGRVAKIGKAGNPDTPPGVDIIIRPGTEGIAGERRILTAGGFTYFYGLEAAIDETLGANALEVMDWITDVVEHGSGWEDAVFLAAVYRAQDA